MSRLRAAGAVVIAKTNMHEIALGITGENPWTGDVRNPLDQLRMSGGSSSGSAAAVRSGIGVASLGTDTAGSIRLPASFCGVVGFRPTHGRAPLEGALPLSPSLDTAGPLALRVADVRRVASVLLGVPLGVVLDRLPRFGVVPGFLEGRLSAGVREAYEALVRGLGAREVAFARMEDASRLQVEVGWPESALVHEEALSSVASLPGVSASGSRAAALLEVAPVASNSALARGVPGSFSPVVLEALLRGRAIEPDVRRRASEQRRELTAALDEALRDVDALILPAAPVVAPLRGTTYVELESGQEPLRPALLALLVPFSMAGLPVVSVPFCEIDGLPVNVQIVARRGEDALCLALALWFEQHHTPTSRR